MGERSDIPLRRARLSAAKKALLESRLRGGRPVAASAAIASGERPALVPLSATQKRLWFFQQLNPGSIVAARAVSLLLDGSLDVSVVERCLTEIVRRHEILRTVYGEGGGEPWQRVLEPQPVHVKTFDLGGALPEARQAQVRRIAVEEARRIADLSQGPVFVPLLFTFERAKNLLLLISHHIAFDGWSEIVLIRELALLYEAFLGGRSSPLQDLPIQYADFALWQDRRSREGAFADALEWWKKRLHGMEYGLPVPVDFPRPASAVLEREQVSFMLPAALVERLESLGRNVEATLFMVLLAAFKVLLYRYSGQEDISVGTLIAGRTRTEVEPLIGCFANLLVMRTDLSGEPTFRTMLERVRDMAPDAYAHQELPFETLVEALHPGRRLVETPVFQVLFQLRNFPDTAVSRGADLLIRKHPFDFGRGTWALILDLTRTTDGLQCTMEFAAGLFRLDRMQRLAGHYRTLLESIVSDPDQQITRIPILTGGERQQLAQWSTSRAAYTGRACLHQLFEAQAEKLPERIAVVCGDTRLTYRALNEKANRLARRLSELGVGPESLVGLYLDRSPEMIVAILAVLKAGGAYVPLETSYPSDRLAFMLRDTNASVVITRQMLAANLPVTGSRVLGLDAEREVAAQDSLPNPVCSTTPDNLAYVIYTSGSTGTPKGVLVSHHNIVRLFDATRDWFSFDENDIWTLFHSYAFDFSVWELWGALLFGGRIVIVPYETAMSPPAFQALLAREQVTVLNQTPSAFRHLMQSDEGIRHPKLRLIIFGGEALQIESLKPWFERHGDQHPRLVNMYGITETTVHVSYRPLSASDASSAGGSRIGTAIPDLELRILDSSLQPVPVGVAGEICIGGAGLARGYLNRPELTSQRFVSNPFNSNPGARLYRSGDLARYTSDGDIEYIGRADHQVKIRGFRVELGEIESLLREHEKVREAAVVFRDDGRLVAHVALWDPRDSSTDGLRTWLKRSLPDYMVPSHYVVLDALPLTSGGKVDRRALPDPGAVPAALPGSFEPPRTPAEERVAGIWCEILGIERVGVHDDFFDLGGHSLLFTRLASRIAEAFHVRVPLRVLFDSPTIDLMTLAILQRQVQQSDQDRVRRLLDKVSQLSPERVRELLRRPDAGST